MSGASGMIGSALISALADCKTSVIQLVRGSPAAPGQLQWDPLAKQGLTGKVALEGCAAAVHLSGANVSEKRWTEAYRSEITASRIDSTRVLAQTLASLQKRPQALLVASAIGIYGDRGDEFLTEASAPGNGFLADVCRQWEAAAQPAVEAGIRVVHLRFGVVLSPGHGALAQMLPLFRRGLGGKLGSGRQWMSWISLADTIGAILFALDSSSLAGPMNLTAPNPVTNAEFTRSLGHQLKRPAVLAVPAFALRLALGQMADEAILASARVLPSKLQMENFQFKHPTLDDALAAILP